jgi:ComF family protein
VFDASGGSLSDPPGRGRFVFSSSGGLTRSVATNSEAGARLPASWLRGIAESLFATIFPSECRLCDSFLTNISRLPVCNECISAMRPMEGEFCAVCGERLSHRQSLELSDPLIEQYVDRLCGTCRTEAPPYAAASAFGSYDTGLRKMIHLLKYDKVRPAASVLGAMLAEAITKLQPAFAPMTVLVTPVPLHSRKQRERGFNQAEAIARIALKDRTLSQRLELGSHLLKRRRVTQSQIGLTQHQRRENLRGAFTVTNPEAVTGREVLLVDDVFTTGTTASECARVLRRAGARKVWVATVARTLKRSAQPVEGLETISAAMAG